MKTLTEIFQEVQDADTRAKRQEILKENDSFALRTILQLNYDKTIELDLPSGQPPFTVNEAPAGKFESVVKGLGSCTKMSKQPKIKKERIFISILEGVSEDDAKIICRAKDKKLEKLFSRVSESLVKSIWPQFVK